MTRQTAPPRAQDALCGHSGAVPLLGPCLLQSWVATSTVHGYTITHLRGTFEECEAERMLANYPHTMQTRAAAYPMEPR